MRELVAAGALGAGLALLAPPLTRSCDRRGTLARLGTVSRPGAGAAPGPFVGAAEFFDALSRSVRSGLPASLALAAAPDPSPGVRRARELLAAGEPLATALSGSDPLLAVAAGCLVGTSFSAAALDEAARHHREQARLDDEAGLAVAHARHSARVLTLLPVVIFSAAFLLSDRVRSGLAGPVPLALGAAGIALNALGAAWMSRIVSRARSAGSSTAAADIAVALACHVGAGGTIPAAFSLLAPLHPACDAVDGALRRGEPLPAAVSALDALDPVIGRTIVSAHLDGLPVVGALERVASDLRAARHAETLGAIRRIPVRATAPLVLCVLPSFVLLSVVPVALAALGPRPPLIQ